MAAQNTPLILSLLASSVRVAHHAGNVIREILKKGELNIVDKVRISLNI